MISNSFRLRSHLDVALVQLSAAQAPMKWKIHDLNRPVPPVIDPGTQARKTRRDVLHLTPSFCLTAKTCRTGSTKMASREMESRERLHGGRRPRPEISPRAILSEIASFTWSSPSLLRAGRKPGARQQRRLPDGPVRNSGAGFLPEQNLRRRTSLRGVRAISAAGECCAASGAVADATTSSFIVRISQPIGKVAHPARVTILHNGVLVQDNVELTGPTAHGERPPYKPGPDKLPLQLQDHGDPVRYRNIWVRELHEE